MKLQVLTATALLALFTATTASAGKLVVDTSNYSDGAIAVGDTIVAAGAIGPGGAAGFIGAAGGRAMAGSVQVNANVGCGCKRKVTVVNDSMGAVAVGNASAGSTTINL